MYICTVSIGRYCIGGKDNMMKVDVFVYYIYIYIYIYIYRLHRRPDKNDGRHELTFIWLSLVLFSMKI